MKLGFRLQRLQSCAWGSDTLGMASGLGRAVAVLVGRVVSRNAGAK